MSRYGARSMSQGLRVLVSAGRQCEPWRSARDSRERQFVAAALAGFVGGFHTWHRQLMRIATLAAERAAFYYYYFLGRDY